MALVPALLVLLLLPCDSFPNSLKSILYAKLQHTHTGTHIQRNTHSGSEQQQSQLVALELYIILSGVLYSLTICINLPTIRYIYAH